MNTTTHKTVEREVNENQGANCSHLDQITQGPGPAAIRKAHAGGCPECIAKGDTWVHLRLCMICGHVGCCDDSKNKHATAHYHSTTHPIMRSIEPGEDWGFCYADQANLDFSPKVKA